MYYTIAGDTGLTLTQLSQATGGGITLSANTNMTLVSGLSLFNFTNQAAYNAHVLYQPNGSSSNTFYLGTGLSIRGDGQIANTFTGNTRGIAIQCTNTRIAFSDANKGIGYAGRYGSLWLGAADSTARPNDGVVVWGYTDGALGTVNVINRIALYWNANGGTTNGTVGIFNTSPGFNLDITGKTRATGGFIHTNASSSNTYHSVSTNTTPVTIYTLPIGKFGYIVLTNEGISSGNGSGFAIYNFYFINSGPPYYSQQTSFTPVVSQTGNLTVVLSGQNVNVSCASGTCTFRCYVYPG